MDLYSRKIIAHIINDRMDSKLVEDTLKLALARRNWTKGLILHSDKGSQYRSKAFKNILNNNELNNLCVEKEIAMIMQQWSLFIQA